MFFSLLTLELLQQRVVPLLELANSRLRSDLCLLRSRTDASHSFQGLVSEFSPLLLYLQSSSCFDLFDRAISLPCYFARNAGTFSERLRRQSTLSQFVPLLSFLACLLGS